MLSSAVVMTSGYLHLPTEMFDKHELTELQTFAETLNWPVKPRPCVAVLGMTRVRLGRAPSHQLTDLVLRIGRKADEKAIAGLAAEFKSVKTLTVTSDDASQKALDLRAFAAVTHVHTVSVSSLRDNPVFKFGPHTRRVQNTFHRGNETDMVCRMMDTNNNNGTAPLSLVLHRSKRISIKFMTERGFDRLNYTRLQCLTIYADVPDTAYQLRMMEMIQTVISARARALQTLHFSIPEGTYPMLMLTLALGALLARCTHGVGLVDLKLAPLPPKTTLIFEIGAAQTRKRMQKELDEIVSTFVCTEERHTHLLKFLQREGGMSAVRAYAELSRAVIGLPTQSHAKLSSVTENGDGAREALEGVFADKTKEIGHVVKFDEKSSSFMVDGHALRVRVVSTGSAEAEQYNQSYIQKWKEEEVTLPPRQQQPMPLPLQPPRRAPAAAAVAEPVPTPSQSPNPH
jgi:hypothetical protein